MKLISLPIFTDNYVWILHDGESAFVVDPGEAPPVLEVLHREKLELKSILVTHHHSDHTGGVSALRQATGAKVFGPAKETIPKPLTGLNGGDSFTTVGLTFRVIDVPGHTAGHIAYFCHPAGQAPLLFCGDTLFSGGCGRLFEGSPGQMLSSLDALGALPPATRVCCTHEYTLNNLKFATAVDPLNQALAQYTALASDLRARHCPTLPSTIGLELQINPFLRTRNLSIIAAVKSFDTTISAGDEVGVFAALREWKNRFQ
jgi:hydroxyacylglutathione hydrolase